MTAPYTLNIREETIQSGLRGYLLTLPEVRLLCDERVYPRQRTPGATMPCITFFTLSEEGYDVMGGTPSETLLTTMQLDLWTRSERDTRVLAWAIRGTPDQPRLHCYPGGEWNGINVQTATILATRDLDEPPEGEGEQGIYRTSLDVSICWDEPREA